jgi:predicted  nucleic acid-binding Zn-ribbon protein
MEKMNNLLGKLEENVKTDFNIEIIEKFENGLTSMRDLMNQINEKNEQILKNYDKILETNFEKIINSIKNTITKNFSDNIPKSMNFQFSTPIDILKQIIKPKLEKVINDLADDNIWGISAYNEIVNDFKLRMQLRLAEELEKSLSGGEIEIIRTDEDKAMQEIELDLESIEPEINTLKTKLNETMKFLESNRVINDVILPKLNDFCKNMNSSFSNIREEVIDKKEKRDSVSIDLINQVKDEIEKYKEIIKERDILNEELNEVKVDLESAKRQLDENTDNSRKKVQDLENELDKNKQEVERLQKELEEKLNSLEGDLSSQQNKINELTTNLEIKEKNIVEIQESNQTLLSEKNALNDQISDLKSRVNSLNEEIQSKNVQIGQINDTLNSKEQEITKLKTSKDDLEGLKADLDKEKEELISKNEILNNQILELRKELEESKTKLENKDNNLVELQNERRELDEKVKALRTEKEELNNKNMELGNKLNALNVEIESKNTKIEQINATLSSKEREIIELKTAKDGLEGIKTNINKEKEELISKNEILNNQMLQLKKELEESNAKLENKDNNLTELQNLRQELDEKAKYLQAEKEELNNKNIELENKVKEAENKIKDLGNNFDSKISELEGLKGEYTNLTQEKSELISNNSELQNQINKITSEKQLLEQKIKEKDILITELEPLKDQAEKTDQLEAEIKELLQFIENSPKYQLLYLINNLGETTFNHLVELFKFNEAITKTILDEFSEKEYIEISGDEENPIITIKQKLNPISYLNLESVYHHEKIYKLANFSDDSSFNTNFHGLIDLVDEKIEEHKEQAGYLISVLYLYIYESKNFHLLKKLRPYIDRLNPNSFYIRLVNNMFSKKRWKSDIIAQKNTIIDISKINIFSENLELLEPENENYPKDGPFTIEKYRPLSIFEWEDTISVKDTALNKFKTIPDLLKWIHLNGEGYNSFEITIRDSMDKRDVIISSTTDKITTDTIINKFDFKVEQ